MTTDQDEATTAADAWAKAHECYGGIRFCAATPLDAFRAGWEQARASERQRIRHGLTELLSVWGDTEVPAFQIIAKVTDLLDGDGDE